MPTPPLKPGHYHIAIPLDFKGNDPLLDPGTKIRPVSETEAESMRKIFGKVNRNEDCPCGSGRKYKKCCLRKDFPHD
jgi:hypothetical protein